QAYANSRVCSPSRASIMTGQFPARHGITDWIGALSGEDWRRRNRYNSLLPAEYQRKLSAEHATIAEELRENGYHTFFAGKWHLGGPGSYPEDHGFNINKGGWEKGSPMGGFFSPWENPKLSNQYAGESLSMRLAKETTTFLDANKDTSFFAMLSFYAVHAPLQSTESKWRKYQQKAQKQGVDSVGYRMERRLPIRIVQDNPVYAGLLEQMDEAIGLVLDKLEELGLTDNTIVVFTSDNGGVASGDAFATTNLPLRGGKGYQWEGGLRVPLFIRNPGQVDPSGTCKWPVTGADLYPTLLSLVGLPLEPKQHLDGVDLAPLLRKGEIKPRLLYWHYPHYGNQGGEPSSIIQDGAWKLIYYWETGEYELYHLEKDPSEHTDVAPIHPHIAEPLKEKLLDWLMEVESNYPQQDSLYQPKAFSSRLARIVEHQWPALEAKRLRELQDNWQPNADWWGSKVEE
ncbi:MAG: sulfatase, partial [Bacteroidota bacterium]